MDKLTAAGSVIAASAAPTIDFIANTSRRESITSSGAEIRVHGVGDHATFSALGRPGYENKRQSQVVISEPPNLPAHRLLLIAWSRANRRLTRTLWWYLLFPFTLINVAGYMTPRRRIPALTLRVSVSIVSIVLTVCLAAWVTVIVETVWLAVADSADHLTAKVALCLSGPVAVGAVIVKRMRRDDDTSRCGQVSSWTHLVALVVSAIVLFSRPATWGSSGDAVTRGVRAIQTEAHRFDPMACLLIASTGVVLVAALMLAAAAVHTRITARDQWASRDGSALAAAALLLVIATAVLHTAGSLLRLVTQWMYTLFEDIRDGVAASDPTAAQAGAAGAAQRAAAAPGDTAHMLLSHPQSIFAPALRIDLLLGFFVILLVIIAANVTAAAAINVATRRGTRSGADTDTRPMSRWHSILHHAPGCLSYVTLSTVLMTVAAWWTLAGYLVGMAPSELLLSRNIILVVGVVVIGFLVVRRPERAGEWIKGIFEMVADIAGFWAPRSVPLAGASYRGILMDGIGAALEGADNDRVALVGHSQGSVICAWFMYRLREPQSRITLFTCGSPLWSLYAAFFPTYFGREFFRRVCANSARQEWFNYWRLTDPIATALPCAHDDDVTELRSEPLRGHSEYWREPQLRDDIDHALQQVAV